MSSPRTYMRDTIIRPDSGRLEDQDAAYHPSGRYRLTMRGIFFWFSSLMAICKGSVSPSRSTSTGAFILEMCQNNSPRRSGKYWSWPTWFARPWCPKHAPAHIWSCRGLSCAGRSAPFFPALAPSLSPSIRRWGRPKRQHDLHWLRECSDPLRMLLRLPRPQCPRGSRSLRAHCHRSPDRRRSHS